MAAANTTALTALQRTALVKRSGIITRNKVCLYDLGIPKDFPEKGKVIQHWKHVKFPVSTTAISETETTATTLSLAPATVTATLAAYGAMSDATELRQYTSWAEDAQQMKDLSELLGIAKAETYEALYNILLSGYASTTGGLTKIYASQDNGTGRSNLNSIVAGDQFSTYWLDYAVMTIDVADAQEFDNNGFVAVVDPNTKFHIMQDTKFVNVVQYQNSERIFNNEIGRWGNCRILKHSRYVWTGDNTTQFFGGSTSADQIASGLYIQPVYVLGKEAFMTSKLDTDNTRGFIQIKDPDSGNVWGNIKWMGFKFWWAGAITDATYGATVYCSRN